MAKSMAKLREMDREELEAQQAELAEELFRLRFQIASGQMEGLKRYREARRDLARVKTLLGGMAATAQKEPHGS
jgi:large subunit ribosomal protein L29